MHTFVGLLQCFGSVMRESRNRIQCLCVCVGVCVCMCMCVCECVRERGCMGRHTVCVCVNVCVCAHISRVPDQNGVSQA